MTRPGFPGPGFPGPPAGFRATWAEVDLDRLATNFAALRALAGRQSVVLPVVKANAYGHGATPVARRLEAEGAVGLCVAFPEEGLELRRAGISVPILCVGAVEPGQIVAAARSRITLALYSPEQLEIFEQAGRAAGLPVHFHLKIDTGLSRLGLLPEEIGPFLEALRTCRSALLAGIFSNLAAADKPGETSNARQAQILASAAEAIRTTGHDPRPVHIANSAGLLFHPALRYDAVRPGILLYGVPPVPGGEAPGFAPVLALKTTVIRVKTVPEGTAVGYGGTWRAARPTRLATLAIGYDDGLPRSLAGKGEILIGGRRAALVGVISMDLAAADVTGFDGVEAGAEAVIIGSQGSETIGLWEVAERAGSIPWEILCGIGRRVPRVHFAGTDIVSVSNPLPMVRESELVSEPPTKPRKRPPLEAPGETPQTPPEAEVS